MTDFGGGYGFDGGNSAAGFGGADPMGGGYMGGGGGSQGPSPQSGNKVSACKKECDGEPCSLMPLAPANNNNHLCREARIVKR